MFRLKGEGEMGKGVKFLGELLQNEWSAGSWGII